MKTNTIWSFFIGLFLTHFASAAEDLQRNFVTPPAPARPWVYWFPLDGNISSNGITADLEAMKRVGIGGVLYMETEQGTPRGPAKFGGPLWRDLFKHICAEASRLGLEVNMNNDAGWCGSGGPWITPDLSMQRIVWAETNITGPLHFEGNLPQPASVMNYYGDIAVFAFPVPDTEFRLPHLNGKSASAKEEIPLRATFPVAPAGASVAREKIINLTDHLSADGRLSWNLPAGKWRIVRMGHTSTGTDNHPAPMDGRGLESDKLSREATDAHFNGLMAKLIADNQPLVGQGRTLVTTHIDSWETGSQNWTPKFREEFQRLRGYDPFPLLPVFTGQVVDSVEVSERFLWDVRMTVNQLLLQNYAGRFRELARQHGMHLSIEAYDGVPADDMTYAGCADEPMAEFWSWSKFGAAYSCTEMASAAHIYGKRILGAEAFTATDAEKWQGHPANIKDLGDWAFCEGINRFVFHRYALQPWTNPDRAPGVSMGPWGLHYERTQTWWEQSKAWHEYLARCQYLLRQGLFVADLCFLEPENSPQRFKSPVKSGFDRPGYNFDGCTPEAVLTRMSVQDGKLVLPDGMSYRVLVLPLVETMSPELLRKVKELVEAGATIAGPPPMKSPSLSHYPACDAEVQTLARELWGNGAPPQVVTEHPFGKGRILWGGELQASKSSEIDNESLLAKSKWIWRKEGQPAVSAPPGKRYFRRVFIVETASAVSSAQLLMTADNSFECWVNGQPVGNGDNFNQVYSMNIKAALKPGANILAVAAVNATDSPNPAGLIGVLNLQYADDSVKTMPTDQSWQAATEIQSKWNVDPGLASGWETAMELGFLGMQPWGDVDSTMMEKDPIPDINILCRVLANRGVPPDFSGETRDSSSSLRYIHRVIEGADLYFVANKNPQSEISLCKFRVTGRRPELWWPDTGRTERVAVYDEKDGIVRVPIHFEPSGSVFVLFRAADSTEAERIVSINRNGEPVVDASSTPGAWSPQLNDVSGALNVVQIEKGKLEVEAGQSGNYELKRADGKSVRVNISSLPKPMEITGSWELSFPPKWGAPEHITLDKLISWSDHADPGVKYFSGTATYKRTINIPPGGLAANYRWYLDLGKVSVMAEVSLNGKNLGILWKPPFTVDITKAAKDGGNLLEVEVVNLWINRQIGDEQLPEDSERNPEGTLKNWPQWLTEGKPNPAGRYAFASWRLWKKNDALVESGLIGPVVLRASEIQKLASD